MGVSSSSGCDRQIARLETRVATLEQTKSYDVLPLEVARQLQVMRGQLLDEAASRWADVAQPLQAETVGNRQRVDALEQWLREALAPELVRLQLDLASERRCRERLETAVNKHVALSKTLERASITPRRHTQTLQGSQATLTSLQRAPPFAPSDNLDKCAFSASSEASEALRTGVELASSQSRQSRSVPLVPDAAPRESALHGHVEASLTTEKADRRKLGLGGASSQC
ncbi:unnamed protein product [Symbiodinium natans]|uniref:Uncharacterized protein n=1 Tax=Symbiodinium natans TaxID=878477 RepID=A0A812SZL3_9DINO|nr:unnamed protein product [Symbiodinium natans]